MRADIKAVASSGAVGHRDAAVMSRLFAVTAVHIKHSTYHYSVPFYRFSLVGKINILETVPTGSVLLLYSHHCLKVTVILTFDL